jgi:hypothetical protein
MNGKLKVSVTWGDGPDMLLVNEEKSYMLYDELNWSSRFTHGESFKGSFELTLQEAVDLRNQLNMAIQSVESLEQSVKDYFENESNNN